jgi:hypothetical protein
MMALIFSPGMFHASASFLPSSFTMYTTFLGMSMFMNWRGGLKTSQGIFCFAVGGILGWPFSMALCVPFLVEEAVFAFLSDKDAVIEAIMRGLRGVIAGILALVSVVSRSNATSDCLTVKGGRISSFRFLLQEGRCRPIQHRVLQHLCWPRKRARYLWNRAMAFLCSKSPPQL